LPIQDVELDQKIAQFVVGDFLVWLDRNTDLVLTCRHQVLTRSGAGLGVVIGFVTGVVMTLAGIGVLG
jgi:hypothetical protein